MFGLGDFMLSPDMRQRMTEQRERRAEVRMSQAVAWGPNTRWVPELNIRASTYRMPSLFDVAPLPGSRVNGAQPEQLVVSPSERWCYCEKVLSRGRQLATASGSRQGTVVFDGDVLIPAIHEKLANQYAGERWRDEPWMSLTPMEILTLRPGTRRAKGRVIVAGLGLGHQLIEVSKRKQVKHLTLVERDQELVDWFLPRIKPLLGRPVDEVVVGDANVELPKLTADVALVDIFPSYGGNCWERDRLRHSCKAIGFVWAWGAPELRGGW